MNDMYSLVLSDRGRLDPQDTFDLTSSKANDCTVNDSEYRLAFFLFDTFVISFVLGCA